MEDDVGQPREVLLRAPAGIAAGLDGAGGKSAWLVTAAGEHGLGGAEAHDDLHVELAPNRITIDELHCRGCARCIEVCSFDAIHLVDPNAATTTARVDPALCRGCNLCTAVCPTDAALPSTFTAGWWGERLADVYRPLLAAPGSSAVFFACRRRLDAVAAALALHRLDPARIELVPLRCAGEVDAGMLLELHRHGAGEIVVAGCGDGACRYEHGPRLAAEQVDRVNAVLGALETESPPAVSFWVATEPGDESALPPPTLPLATRQPERCAPEQTREA